MAILKVLEHPHPTLSKKSSPVSSIGRAERRLVRDMIDTMYQEDGVGLAAPQVGESKQIIVISPRAQPGEERALINPKIIERSPEEELGIEGCLSLPGITVEVPRAIKIKIGSTSMAGKKVFFWPLT